MDYNTEETIKEILAVILLSLAVGGWFLCILYLAHKLFLGR